MDFGPSLGIIASHFDLSRILLDFFLHFDGLGNLACEGKLLCLLPLGKKV